MPLRRAPGEAYQFDWNHEVVLINGVMVTVKVAHKRRHEPSCVIGDLLTAELSEMQARSIKYRKYAAKTAVRTVRGSGGQAVCAELGAGQFQGLSSSIRAAG